MRKLIFLLTAAFLTSSATAAVPTAESIDTLLVVTKAERLLDGVSASVDSMMKQSMATALDGKTPTPEQQRVLDSTRERMAQIVRDEMTWAKFEPVYIQIYQETFTQEEIDALIAFYRTPVGMAYVDKLPVALQKTMTATQAMLGPMTRRMQAVAQDAARDARAATPAPERP